MSQNENISNAFAASLSFGFNKEASDISLTHEDEQIQKYAGINIYQPTVDNIEMFVRKYLMNELAFFPKIANIGVELTPSKFNSATKEYIDEASGVASVVIDNVKLEFPFMIVDGELVPFDVIQLGKQRVPYTRENLKKIMFGIANTKKSTSPVKDFEPYIKVDKPVNPTSSIGFLGDVLRIQEQYQGRANGGGLYITTSEAVDALLEKTAGLETLTEERLKAIEGLVRNEIVKNEVESLKKEAEEFSANEAELEKHANLYARLDEVQFKNAVNLPNGTQIKFPEIHKNEITLTNGVIIDDYMDFAGWFPKPLKVVISQDGRMKILENGDIFLCLEGGDHFTLPMSSLDELQNRDTIIAFDGNKALYPSYVDWIQKRFMKPIQESTLMPGQSVEPATESQAVGLVGTSIYQINPIFKNAKLMNLFADNGANRTNDVLPGEEVNIKIVPLEGAKFVEMPYNEYVKKKSAELGMDEMTFASLVSQDDVVSYRRMNKDHSARNIAVTSWRSAEQDHNIVICTDPKTKVLVVKGVITGYIKSLADLRNAIESEPEFEVTAGEQSSGIEKKAGAFKNIETDVRTEYDKKYGVNWGEDDELTNQFIRDLDAKEKAFKATQGIQKKASLTDYVEVRMGNKDDKLYNIKIFYTDRTGKAYKPAHREFKNIPEMKLRGILKVIGYDIPKISEIMNRAPRENFVKMDLPAQSGVDKLRGGQVGMQVDSRMKAIKSKLFDSKVTDALAAELLGQLLGGSLSGSSVGENLLGHMRRVASETAALSATFEKLAQETKSQQALKVAKLMTIANNLTDKVAGIVEGDIYPKMKEVVADVVAMRPELEKTAYDLMALKAQQYAHRNHVVNPNYIQAAVENLDHMYKVAATLHRYAGHEIEYGEE